MRLFIQYLTSPLQCNSSHQEDKDDDVGEGGGEVDHLAARLDPLEEAQEVDQPGDAKAEEHPPARLAHL